jgi:hypothetical protein
MPYFRTGLPRPNVSRTLAFYSSILTRTVVWSAKTVSFTSMGEISHDQVTRFLSSEMKTSKDLWLMFKPFQRRIESAEGVLILDDSIEENYPDDFQQFHLAL